MTALVLDFGEPKRGHAIHLKTRRSAKMVASGRKTKKSQNGLSVGICRNHFLQPDRRWKSCRSPEMMLKRQLTGREVE